MKRCDYCHKPFGKEGEIYIAGSICQGHRLTIWEYIVYRVTKALSGLQPKRKL